MKKKLLVKELYEELKPPLSFELLAGSAGLLKSVDNSRIQKPGLALAGFLKHLHTERVQIFGETEISYLNYIGKKEGKRRVRDLFSLGLSCVVVTKGLEVPDYLIEAAEDFTTPLIRSPKVSSYCIEVISDFLEDRLSPEISLHGVLLDVFGVGVLITGDSGIGKSECALDLISRGHRLVADDIVIVKNKRGVLWGTAPVRVQHLMEVRGLGIVDIKDLFGVSSIRERKRLDMIVRLLKWSESPSIERLSFTSRTKEVLGVKVPYVEIPVSPGRNIALLVEVASKLFLLHKNGITFNNIEKLLLGVEVDGKGVE